MTESNITLSLPEDSYFRFQDCDGYNNIQIFFKEMDVCWLDSENNILYLIELKDWRLSNLTTQEDQSKRTWDLVKKSVDSLCMMLSILLKTDYSGQIQNCCPFEINGETKMKFIIIVDCEVQHASYMSAVNSLFKSRFNAYVKLFNIKTATVLRKEIAVKKFDWVS